MYLTCVVEPYPPLQFAGGMVWAYRIILLRFDAKVNESESLLPSIQSDQLSSPHTSLLLRMTCVITLIKRDDEMHRHHIHRITGSIIA